MSTFETFRPAMRALEIIPFSQEGDPFLLLRDPQGISADAAVPELLARLLALFDGTRTIEQIIVDYQEVGGEELPSWFLEKTLTDLDENYMLESPRFRQHLLEITNEYSNATVRPATFAGLSYPDEPEA
jgi:hypothetical protein